MRKVLYYVWVWPFKAIQQRWGTKWAAGSYVAAFVIFLTIVGSTGASDTAATDPGADAAAAAGAMTLDTEPTPEDSTTQEAPADPAVDTAALEASAVRTLAAVDRIAKGHYVKALPKRLRASNKALNRLLGAQLTISLREADAAQKHTAILRVALRSGEIRKAVKSMKADERAAREKKRREAEAAAAAAEAAEANCDSNYSGCLDPNASDYDCAGGSGNGPLYTGEVESRGSDPYGLDADGDGVGCEPY